MSDNNWLSLIFDKFAKSHHYKNETTMNVMISDLNNQDNGYEHFVGEEALKLYDTKFGNKFGIVPYVIPGFDLAKLAFQVFKKNKI